MPAARDWEDTIRAVVSHALSQKGCRMDRGEQSCRSRHRGIAAVLAPGDWEELIAAFREHKLISGEIKPSTWHRVYRHHVNQVLGAVVVWP